MSDFESNQIKVSLENQPECQVKLEITILPEASQKAYEEAVKAVRKHVSIPGFRKGKVPANMVKEKYASDVHREFLDSVVNNAVQEAIFLTKQIPLDRGKDLKVKMVEEVLPEKGGIVNATFEAYPEVPEIKPSEIEVEDIAVEEVTQDAIDKHIYLLQVQQAEKEEVKDRPAQEGDIVELEVSPSDNPEEKRPVSNIHLHKDYTEKEVFDAVIGLNIDEIKENISAPNAPEGEETPKINITLKSIHSATLPEVDEKFLEKMNIESEDKLREEINNYYKRQNETNRRQSLHYAIEHAIVEKYDFDVPKSMNEAEKDRIVASIEEEIKDDEKDSVVEKAYKDAKNSLKLQFILSKVIGEQNINVSDDEVSSQLMQVLMQNRELLSNQNLDFGNLKSRIQNSMMFEKALDYLADHVNLVKK